MATSMMQHVDEPIIERESLCLSGILPGLAIHAGEAEFKANLDKHFAKAENNTAENLVKLKTELRTLDTPTFWERLMVGLSQLCRAQFGFVSKRILVDDHNSAVEMPPLGEVGSCLMGVAFYWNDGKGSENMVKDYKYYAWSAPCSYMRHDKVFLVPEGMSTFITENPNQLPFECDAYLGVPLFADGRCFAHFGLMWTNDGLEAKRDLSWGYLEMVMHSLEDMITERLVSGQGFAKSNVRNMRVTETPEAAAKVIPQEHVTAAQSLKPYAQSLSHELRTPMQGVVGMLDVMYATVQEQIEEQSNGRTGEKLRNVFQTLRDNIETVQDSSKRAVEAADNVVYAYDLNMQVPDTPLNDSDIQVLSAPGYFDSRPKMVEGSNIVNPFKRRRNSSNTWNFGNSTKIRNAGNRLKTDCDEIPQSPMGHCEATFVSSPTKQTPVELLEMDARFEFPRPSLMTPADTEHGSTPGVRQSNIRDLIPIIIHDALRVGGRPDSAISEPTLLGERIEVRSRSSNGYSSQKIVEWSVDTDVPDLVALDERDLSKLVSAVLLNALKFTERGTINLQARLSQSRRYVLLSVIDTGSGIPEDFLPELFKPFAKEDHSITRTKEGLGLGLLVAKGLARRTGGDIVLIRSSTEGHDQGTEFEIRIPIEHGERASRGNTPFSGTPDRNMTRNTPNAQATSRPQLSSPFLPSSPTRMNAPPIPSLSKPELQARHEDKQTPSVPRDVTSTPARSTQTSRDSWDRKLAEKHPLRFLVAEDNKINRKLLVNMLSKFGYKNVYEAFDGREAVRVMDKLMKEPPNGKGMNAGGGLAPPVDVILMDLWMPEMDGYEATEKILGMFKDGPHNTAPIILAVSADVTEQAVDRATRTGMQGYMTKPYKLNDLQRLILEFCATKVA